jgi:hypothetical protein
LLGDDAWASLPEPVRRRFSKRLTPGDAALYQGQVITTDLSWTGRMLSILAWPIGSPLPSPGTTGPAVVMVTEEPALQGQRWVRLYGRPGRRPQLVQSAKRFRGPTGLEEHVGGGIGMVLGVTVEDGSLVFRSKSYFVEWRRFRLALPRWLSPGQMVIVHEQAADGTFVFSLTLVHARFGRLVYQAARFSDVDAATHLQAARLSTKSTASAHPGR